MKSRDTTAVDALRSALSALDNAEAVTPSTTISTLKTKAEHAEHTKSPIAGAVQGAGAGDVARRDLTEDEIEAIVAAEIEERRAAADHYDRLGRPEEATRLRSQADVLEKHFGADEPHADA